MTGFEAKNSRFHRFLAPLEIRQEPLFQKNAPNLKQLHLSDLRGKCPNLSPKECDYFAEGSAIAFQKHAHKSGVELLVDGDSSVKFKVTWELPDTRGSWKEPNDYANFGAVAVGLLLVLELTDYTVIEQSPIGTGFDYYLGYREDHPEYNELNFLNARLEISGTNQDSTNVLAQLLRKKIKQTDASDSTNLPAFVAVTQFSKPITFFKRK